MKQDQEFVLRLNAIIETAIDGIITIDAQGIIETVNHAVSTLFQYSKEEMIGNNISMLMPEPDRSQHDRYISNYLSTKVAKIIGIGREVQGKKKDGTVFPFRLAVSEVILNDRIIFTGIVHDLSETKEAQEELRNLNNQLEHKIAERTDELEKAINRLIKTNRKLEKSEEALTEALQSEKQTNELKSRFITTASHEFRTPLSTILSSASLIGRYTTEDQQPQRLRHIEKIKNSVNHLTGILNDFLDLSKLEEGKINLQVEELPLNTIVRSIFSELDGMKKDGQKLVMEAPDDIKIITDKKTLRNTLFNLLSNAIKYSEQGSIVVTIKPLPEQIEISIKDDGMGIPVTEQDYLFERFFRASNVENIQGTGLGLSIVNRYIQLLKGSITFESKENVGTEFYIRLPHILEI
ncbi:PAS domain-containing sensor histidine kinase [Portibacter marinus]|uniref:PAS domain-containing sensor histidine kinase n=1 Tax=Portibacter marinus TaxID=2898660 RepID=UPI001F216843|nr:PAS domain-containing sensor histidine kinase [Portibacter marinus]